MAQSNKAAVDRANIPAAERLDLTIPRNAGKTFHVTVRAQDGTVPAWFVGATVTSKARTAYEASAVALTAAITNFDDADGSFDITYDATTAKGLGIDVLDLVFDCKIVPVDGSVPRRLWAGLLTLGKGVS